MPKEKGSVSENVIVVVAVAVAVAKGDAMAGST